MVALFILKTVFKSNIYQNITSIIEHGLNPLKDPKGFRKPLGSGCKINCFNPSPYYL